MAAVIKVDHAFANGITNEGGDRPQTRFTHDRGAAGLSRLGADFECRCDFLVRLAGREQSLNTRQYDHITNEQAAT